MGDGDLRLFFLSVFYQISSLTASDWPRFFKIGFNRPGGGGDHGELVHATADDGATMDDREPGAYCFANEPEDIGLVCCGQTRETKAAQSSTAPPWWLL